MTRTISSTFIATALAVASLAFAGVAQADDPAAGIAVDEPPPVQLPPKPQADADPEPAPVVEAPAPVAEKVGEALGGKKIDKAADHIDKAADEDIDDVADEDEGEETDDHVSPAYYKGKKALKRFKRHCIIKAAAPSHSDKVFCKLFRKHHHWTGASKPGHARPAIGIGIRPHAGTGATRPATGIAIRPHAGTGATRPGTVTDDAARTGGSTRPAAATDDATPTGGSTRPATATASEQPAAQAEQPSKGSLPFTGFEVWELALLGVALIGGALAARRLLDS